MRDGQYYVLLEPLDDYLSEKFMGQGSARREASLARMFKALCITFVKHGYRDGTIRTGLTANAIYNKLRQYERPGAYRATYSPGEFYRRMRLYVDLGLVAPFVEGGRVTLLVPSEYITVRDQYAVNTASHHAGLKRAAKVKRKRRPSPASADEPSLDDQLDESIKRLRE